MLRTVLLVACAVLLLGAKEPARPGARTSPGAGSVRVYRFDNLDVEGKVKAPQLMYFLKRIRSRFRSFRLPPESFSKRILETRDANFL